MHVKMHDTTIATACAMYAMRAQIVGRNTKARRWIHLIATVMMQQLTQQLVMHGQGVSHDRLIPASSGENVGGGGTQGGWA